MESVLSTSLNRAIQQWMTPHWVALELVERFFPDLSASDVTLEPSCGTGAFLEAIPAGVQAVGVEIDSRLAAIARATTGRRVIEGDFRRVDVPVAPTVIVGNPPFRKAIVDAFLARAHRLLPDEGRVGFILPAYFFQTVSTVDELTGHWGLAQTMIPRNLFNGLKLPLCFAMFRKGRARELIGFALYHEAAALSRLKDRYRAILAGGESNVWRAVVRAALEHLGGTADLAALYREIEGHRPTSCRFWHAKVRQSVQIIAERVGRGVWRLPAVSLTAAA